MAWEMSVLGKPAPPGKKQSLGGTNKEDTERLLFWNRRGANQAEYPGGIRRHVPAHPDGR